MTEKESYLEKSQIDRRVDDLFGKYTKTPSLPQITLRNDSIPVPNVVKKRIGVVILETNELALLYSNLTQKIDGVVFFAVERRILNGTGYHLEWMARERFELI